MTRKPLANVWELACPELGCGALAGEPCRDLRSRTGTLFGRRTHQPRARAIREARKSSIASFNRAVREAGRAMASYSTTINNINWPWPADGTITVPVQTTGTPVWQYWTGTAATSVTYTTQTITWDRWNEWHQPVMRSAEQEQAYQDRLQARREQQAREELAYRQREEKRMAERAVARTRAMDLLDLLVAPEEKVEELDLIQLVGSDGQLYRIEMHRQTVHGNIVRIDEHGCQLGRACVAPRMYDGRDTLPTADGWVGQYLGLKHDAETFLSHANWSSVRPCRQPAPLLVPVAA